MSKDNIVTLPGYITDKAERLQWIKDVLALAREKGKTGQEERNPHTHNNPSHKR